jgi:hypothetical protein
MTDTRRRATARERSSCDGDLAVELPLQGAMVPHRQSRPDDRWSCRPGSEPELARDIPSPGHRVRASLLRALLSDMKRSADHAYDGLTGRERRAPAPVISGGTLGVVNPRSTWSIGRPLGALGGAPCRGFTEPGAAICSLFRFQVSRARPPSRERRHLLRRKTPHFRGILVALPSQGSTGVSAAHPRRGTLRRSAPRSQGRAP